MGLRFPSGIINAITFPLHQVLHPVPAHPPIQDALHLKFVPLTLRDKNSSPLAGRSAMVGLQQRNMEDIVDIAKVSRQVHPVRHLAHTCKDWEWSHKQRGKLTCQPSRQLEVGSRHMYQVPHRKLNITPPLVGGRGHLLIVLLKLLLHMPMNSCTFLNDITCSLNLVVFQGTQGNVQGGGCLVPKQAFKGRNTCASVDRVVQGKTGLLQ